MLLRNIAFTISLFFLACASKPEPETPPNILLIFTDELQFSDIGSYGGDIPTPHLDRLAAEGVRFTRAYTPASMCTPSRFAVLTGQFPGRGTSSSFLTNNPTSEPYSIAWNTWLTPETRTLPRILSDNGYFTGMAGKWHVSKAPANAKLPEFTGSEDPADVAVQEKLASLQDRYTQFVKADGGFDEVASLVWSNNDNHPVKALRFHNFPWMLQGGLDFLDKAARQDKPFFLYLTPTAIHGPNHVADLEADPAYTPDGFRPELRNLQLNGDSLIHTMPAGPARHRYSGIVQTDQLLGRIRKRLEQLNIADRTILIFVADHNIEPGKATSFEKGIHVPMIIAGPGIKGGISDALVSNVDILPTVLEAAGITFSDTIKRDGQSFWPVLVSESTGARQYVFSENGYTRSVSDGRYKYIALRYPERMIQQMKTGELTHAPSYVGTWPQAHSAIAMKAFPNYFDADQLYDLETDPYELNNLVKDASYAGRLDTLQAVLAEHLAGFDHPFSLAPQAFLQTDTFKSLYAINLAYDLNNIPWYRRDHGGVTWPPE